MKRRWVMAAMAAAAWGILACQESMPTALDGDGLPVDPKTVEVVLPWADFAEGLTVYGGYGTASQLGQGVVANDFEGTLDARTLVQFGRYPFRASVADSTGTLVSDSNFVYYQGRVVARFDTLTSTNGDEPVTLALTALDGGTWHAPTATWTLAVDTVGDQRAWPEPGAGPVTPVATATWDPAESDSVVFDVDSATVALWGDTLNAARGARLELQTTGHRVDVASVRFRLDTHPHVNPDSVVTLTSTGNDLTFIYDPVPPPPPDGIRIGGTPSWRTVITLAIPRVLNGPASLCEAVGCPFTLEPSRVNLASLILHTRAVEPAAFQPTDTIRLDVRSVLSADRLPKSPLGSSFIGTLGQGVPPSAFGDEAGQKVAIPLTGLVRGLVLPDSVTRPPSEIALLSLLEPLSLAFGAFQGPDDPDAPVLRLILTAADTVEVP